MRGEIVLNEDYLDYVRTLPCLACQYRPVDADHLKARGWEESKRNDYSAIPLCRGCHMERGAIGNERFEAKWRMNLWEELFYVLTSFLSKRIVIERSRLAEAVGEIVRELEGAKP